MTEATQGLLQLIGVLIIAVAIGMFIGGISVRSYWRDEMIKRGHARYHWMNAKWYWLEDLPEDKYIDPAAKQVEDKLRRQTAFVVEDRKKS